MSKPEFKLLAKALVKPLEYGKANEVRQMLQDLIDDKE